MRLTRRGFLGGAAAAALGGGGIYELVDRLGSAPVRPAVEPAGMPAEQHLLDLATTHSEGIEVVVPPLHSAVVTAKLHDVSDLRGAQQQLEDILRRVDSRYALTPAGLGVTVAWGQPYFDTYVPAQSRAHLPHDRRAQKSVLPPTRRFPSDPKNTILETNDVAVLLRSDRIEHIDAARRDIFALPFFTVTSIRRGFAGGGFGGGQSLPKKMAVAAGVPGADLIPDGSELFLGFTSTQKAGLGPGTIANHETLGYVDLRSDYFRNGTHYPKGTAIPQRADFNTLDNPFAFSIDPKRDGVSKEPAAGVHFVVFNPSGDDFERNRLAMDGVLPGGKKLPVPARNRAQGFNSVLTTTHRQNFLVPPRRHRSFPLADL